jgi:hypothetical protein
MRSDFEDLAVRVAHRQEFPERTWAIPLPASFFTTCTPKEEGRALQFSSFLKFGVPSTFGLAMSLGGRALPTAMNRASFRQL